MRIIKTYEDFNHLGGLGSSRRKTLGGRSQVLDIDENNIQEVLQKYAPWYDINCKTKLYRGVKSRNKERVEPLLILDPTIHNRISIDTDNYYNLIMDNLPKWEEYPKRSKSIIGSLNKSTASDYGTLYRIIPLLENTKVAIAPRHDIWFSFQNAFKTIPPIYTRCIHCGGSGKHNMGGACKPCNGSGDKTITNLKQFNDKLKRDFNLTRDGYSWSEFKNITKNAMPVINDIFDPIKNGFRLINYNNDTNIFKDAEIWTEGKCLLIKDSLL